MQEYTLFGRAWIDFQASVRAGSTGLADAGKEFFEVPCGHCF